MNNIWPLLLEKAFAHHYGCYEALHEGNLGEGLIHLTGGSCEMYLTDDGPAKDALWGKIESLLTRDSARAIVACLIDVNQRPMPSDNDEGKAHAGIIFGCAYSIVAVRRAGDVNLIQLRSHWLGGMWTGAWGNNSCKWDDYPEVTEKLKADPTLRCKGMSAGGGGSCYFWMTFDDFLATFTTVYVCSTYPDEEYQQYLIEGTLAGSAATTTGGGGSLGGSTPKHRRKERDGKGGLTDAMSKAADGKGGKASSSSGSSGENKYGKFLESNTKKLLSEYSGMKILHSPQFEVTPTVSCRISISIMHQDRRTKTSLKENVPIGFHLFRMRAGIEDGSRVFELNDPSMTTVFKKESNPWEACGNGMDLAAGGVYHITPYLCQPNQISPVGFILRIFSAGHLQVIEVPPCKSYMHTGGWNPSNSSAGGPLLLPPPQTTPAPADASNTTTSNQIPGADAKNESGNSSRPGEEKGELGTYFGGGAKAGAKAGRPPPFVLNANWCQNPQYVIRLAGKDGAAPMGSAQVVVILRCETACKDAAGKKSTVGLMACKVPAIDGEKKKFSPMNVRLTPLGEEIPAKKSYLKPSAQHKNARNKPDWLLNDGMEAQDSLEQAEPVEPLPVERRTFLNLKKDWCQMTSYTSGTVAPMKLPDLSPSWAPEGVMVVPSISEAGATGQFSLQVFSDRDITVECVPPLRSTAISGKWAEGTAGGCHMHSTWQKNPIYHIRFSRKVRARVKITLFRNTVDWKEQLKKGGVGTMLGLYVVRGKRPNRDCPSVMHEGQPWSETSFLPMNEVSTPPQFVLDNSDDSYFSIIPATFEPNQTGPFFLTVVSDVDFSLTVPRTNGRSGSRNRRAINREENA